MVDGEFRGNVKHLVLEGALHSVLLGFSRGEVAFLAAGVPTWHHYWGLFVSVVSLVAVFADEETFHAKIQLIA